MHWFPLFLLTLTLTFRTVAFQQHHVNCQRSVILRRSAECVLGSLTTSAQLLVPQLSFLFAILQSMQSQ